MYSSKDFFIKVIGFTIGIFIYDLIKKAIKSYKAKHAVKPYTIDTNQLFKIIKIVNEHTVIVNMGQNDLNENDVLEVYVPGSIVKDIDTDEELGTLDLIKAKLSPVEIYPQMTICTNCKLKDYLINPYRKSERLNVSLDDISGGYPKVDVNLKVGDLVRVSKVHLKGVVL